MREGLLRFKKPCYVRYVDTFPMAAGGKTQKFEMREQAVEDLGLQEAEQIFTA